jgi:hypothetical protein
MDDNTEGNNVIGSTVKVTFMTLGNRTVEGKVDTGATYSSLNAQDIKVNKQNQSVSFICPEISNNLITMELDGSQSVVSADGQDGGTTRPMVKFEVEINGVPFSHATFNLNDRSNMDSPILIGQNILKEGNFIIDVNKDVAPERVEAVQRDVRSNKERTMEVLDAVHILAKHNVTLNEIALFLNQVN